MNIVECVSTGTQMPDYLATALDARIKNNPEGCKTLVRKAIVVDEVQFEPGERAEVSILSTDQPDLSGEVVIPTGVQYETFNKTDRPVLWGHNWQLPPVGRCVWIKTYKEKIRGKTNYPERVNKTDSTPFWLDSIWDLIATRTLNAKSISFLPNQPYSEPTEEELEMHPNWKGCKVWRDVDLWEYSCCSIGVNQQALVEVVNSKSLSQDTIANFGLELPVDPKVKEREELISYLKTAMPYVPKPKPVKKAPDYNKMLCEALNKLNINVDKIVNDILTDKENRGRA